MTSLDNKPDYIQEILKQISIVELLANHGIQPARSYADKCVYHCPLPDHDDSTPSFVVFLDGDFQRFHCFGCQSFGDCINLSCLLDKVSLRTGICKLLDDFGIDIDISTVSEDYLNDLVKTDNYVANGIDLNILISRVCYDHLKNVGFESKEVEKVEKKLAEVDEAVRSMDMGKLKKLHENLVLNNASKSNPWM
jgi:DNA primase|tara:strand:- start:6316 stop:6897 length:582 start_codon:yes stop_codon:yes gene_type:complete